MTRSKYFTLIILTILSGLFTATFIPSNIMSLSLPWYFAPLMLVPLFFSVFLIYRYEGKKAIKSYYFRSFFLIYCYGVTIQFFVFYWILDAIKLFTDVGQIQTCLSFLFICLLKALYYILLFAPVVLGASFLSKKRMSLFALILVSLSVVYLEMSLPRFFHWTFSQFLNENLNLIFYSQFLGASCVSFILFFTALLLAKSLFLNKISVLFSCLLSFFIWFILNSFGEKLLTEKTQGFSKDKEILISYIQPNIDFSFGKLEGLSSDGPKPFSLSRLHDMTLASMNHAVDTYKRHPDLVVWPESALPFNLSKSLAIREWLRRLSKKIKIPILVQGTIISKESFYSSSFLIKDGHILDSHAFHKWILMPLGEYIPFEDFIPYFGSFFRENFLNIENFHRGLEATTIHLTDDIYLAPLICFDSISETLPRAQVKLGDASFFVNQTNFIWMGKGNASYEFSVIDRFRAVENGRSLLLVSNSGPVVAYDPFGNEILNKPELLVSGFGSLKLPINQEKTFYTQYPYLFRIIAFCGFILFLVRLFSYYYKEKRYAKLKSRSSSR